jgi:hypothetical protein
MIFKLTEDPKAKYHHLCRFSYLEVIVTLESPAAHLTAEDLFLAVGAHMRGKTCAAFQHRTTCWTGGRAALVNKTKTFNKNEI